MDIGKGVGVIVFVGAGRGVTDGKTGVVGNTCVAANGRPGAEDGARDGVVPGETAAVGVRFACPGTTPGLQAARATKTASMTGKTGLCGMMVGTSN